MERDQELAKGWGQIVPTLYVQLQVATGEIVGGKVLPADNQEEKWYFSIVDVCDVLTDSKDPTAYWRKLKQRLKEEGNETVTNCHALKMRAADGKMRLTDVADTIIGDGSPVIGSWR